MFSQDYFGFEAHQKIARFLKRGLRTELSAEKVSIYTNRKFTEGSKVKGRLCRKNEDQPKPHRLQNFQSRACDYQRDLNIQFFPQETKPSCKLSSMSHHEIRQFKRKKLSSSKGQKITMLKEEENKNYFPSALQDSTNLFVGKSSSKFGKGRAKSQRSFLFRMAKPRLSNRLPPLNQTEKSLNRQKYFGQTVKQSQKILKINMKQKDWINKREYEVQMFANQKNGWNLSDLEKAQIKRTHGQRLSQGSYVCKKKYLGLKSQKKDSAKVKSLSLDNFKKASFSDEKQSKLQNANKKKSKIFHKLIKNPESQNTKQKTHLSDYQRIKMLEKDAEQSIVNLLSDNDSHKIIYCHNSINHKKLKVWHSQKQDQYQPYRNQKIIKNEGQNKQKNDVSEDSSSSQIQQGREKGLIMAQKSHRSKQSNNFCVDSSLKQKTTQQNSSEKLSQHHQNIYDSKATLEQVEIPKIFKKQLAQITKTLQNQSKQSQQKLYLLFQSMKNIHSDFSLQHNSYSKQKNLQSLKKQLTDILQILLSTQNKLENQQKLVILSKGESKNDYENEDFKQLKEKHFKVRQLIQVFQALEELKKKKQIQLNFEAHRKNHIRMEISNTSIHIS